ncbi:MAG: alpha/beta fold hydrolase [Erythrobacter cryptus]
MTGPVAAHSPGPAIDRRAIPPAARESRWRAGDGHAIRRIDWPGASDGTPRGSILFLPGRGDFYEKYLETLEEWHRAGWRVTASDWRGQAGSGRCGRDAVTGHIADFAIWIDDLAALWAQWVAETPPPHVLAAHSMGGHLVLRALVEHRLAPDAVVLSAPMIGVNGPPLPLGVLHAAARVMCALGDPARQAWKWSEKPGELPAGRQQLLTHDPERYADEEWWRAARSELVMGPASWRWVERAYASWRKLVAPGALEQVHTPVLIISTAADRLVSHRANLAAAARLPRGEIMALGPEAAHEVLREADPVRSAVMARIADFLDRVAPQRPAPA